MRLHTLLKVAGLACAVGLMYWLGRPQDTPTPPSEENPPIQNPTAASGSVSQTVSTSDTSLPPEIQSAATLDAFTEWSARYISADAAGRAALVEEGVRLAQLRRPAFKQLIQDDPKDALAQAVPMVVRQKLPASVVALLEERLSCTGGLEVLAVSPDSDPSEPIYRHIATLGDREWRAYVYGRRAEQMSLERTMMNGVGIDSFMALDESPVRPLEIGEIPDVTKKAVETCPVSGLSTAV